MIKTHSICLFLLCLLPPAAQAIRVPGLYEAEVPVVDQSERVRNEGLQTAFRLVLIKLTGDRQAAGRTALLPLLKQAQNYLQQYRYRQVAVTQQTASGEIVNSMETRLWVKFDENNLNQALRGLSVPIWGKERPSTLVWIAVEDGEGRSLIGLEEGPEYVQAISQRAEKRGIALIYPLLDLDDNAALRASDVWGGFTQPIFDASSRYNADIILTVTIASPVSGLWEAHWSTYIDNQMANWTGESDLLEALLDEGIDNLADILATQFSPTTSSVGINQVILSVSDINNAEQYAIVLKYLSSLNSVSDVEVVQVEKSRVTFVVGAHGGELAVSQAIELGRILEAISSYGGDYRLLP
ncbi:MAG: hypothetical protein ACI9SC_002709 [Gammaproteobacteria bacterium]|jgi:hypothetical protein